MNDKLKIKIFHYSFLIVFIKIVYGTCLAGVSIIGGLTHEQVSQIGKTYEGVIRIRNKGVNIEEIKIYPRDYVFYFEGTNEYGEPGSVERSNANWISFEPNYLVIPPKEEKYVDYIVEVPNIDTLNGSYWSILMVEEAPNPSTNIDSNEKSNINVVMRYGIQMVTHIGDTGIRLIKFLKAKVEYDKSVRLFQVDVENTGERFLKVLVWAEFYSLEGQSFGKYEGKQMRTYPGTSIRQKIDITEVPKGNYKVLLVADCGGEDLFGVNVTVNIEN